MSTDPSTTPDSTTPDSTTPESTSPGSATPGGAMPDSAETDGPGAVARYQIGEVAQITDVTQRTLRFYEEKGLLQPTDRMDGGFRLYSDEDIERIRQIRQLQDLLGFTLAEIKEMVDADEVRAQIRASFRPDRDAAERLRRIEQVRSALVRQLEVIEPKISQLEILRAELRERLGTIEVRRREITDDRPASD